MLLKKKQVPFVSSIGLALGIVILFMLVILSLKGFGYEEPYLWLTRLFAFETRLIQVNHEKVYKGEYLLYLKEQKELFEESGGREIWETDFDGIPAVDIAKQKAVRTICYVKFAKAYAKELALVRSPEEEQAATAWAQAIDAENMGFGLSINKLTQIKRENDDYTRVYELLTKDYSEDEKMDAFEAEYQKWNPEVSTDLEGIKKIQFEIDLVLH